MAQKFSKGEFQKATARTVASIPITTSLVHVHQTRYGTSKRRK